LAQLRCRLDPSGFGKDLLINSATAFAFGAAFDYLAGEVAGFFGEAEEGLLATDLVASRQATAREFYKGSGWSDARIASHLKGIDFSQPVNVVTIPEGTQLVQYQVPGNPTGNYFAPVGRPAESLGVDPTGRVATTYTTTNDVAALSSTAATTIGDSNLPASIQGTGGGTQYFVPDITFLGP